MRWGRTAIETEQAETGPSAATLGGAALSLLILLVVQNVLRGVLGPARQASAAELHTLTQ